MQERAKEAMMPAVLPAIWVGCALAIIIAAVRSRRHPGALRLGRYSMGVLYLGAGAAVNAGLLAQGGGAYRKSADGAYIAYVRDTWHSLVMPNRYVWISLLIAFELAVGVLALLGGRFSEVAYLAAIAFHVALLSFGWGFYFWSIPMIGALVILLRAERSAAPASIRALSGEAQSDRAAA